MIMYIYIYILRIKRWHAYVCAMTFSFSLRTILVYFNVCGCNDYGYCHRAIISLVRILKSYIFYAPMKHGSVNY